MKGEVQIEGEKQEEEELEEDDKGASEVLGTGECDGNNGKSEKQLGDEKGDISFFGSEGFEFVLYFLKVEHFFFRLIISLSLKL